MGRRMLVARSGIVGMRLHMVMSISGVAVVNKEGSLCSGISFVLMSHHHQIDNIIVSATILLLFFLRRLGRQSYLGGFWRRCIGTFSWKSDWRLRFSDNWLLLFLLLVGRYVLVNL